MMSSPKTVPHWVTGWLVTGFCLTVICRGGGTPRPLLGAAKADGAASRFRRVLAAEAGAEVRRTAAPRPPA